MTCDHEAEGHHEHHVPEFRRMVCEVGEDLLFKFDLVRTPVYGEGFIQGSQGPIPVAHRSYTGKADVYQYVDEVEHPVHVDSSQDVHVHFARDNLEGVFSGFAQGGTDVWHFSPAKHEGGPHEDVWMHRQTEREYKHHDGEYRPVPNAAKKMARKLLQLEKFDNCWPGMGEHYKELSMGILCDKGFKENVINVIKGLSAATTAAQEAGLVDYVEDVIAATNVLYRRQMDWTIRVPADKILGFSNVAGYTGEDWDEAPPSRGQKCTAAANSGMSAGDRLNRLRAWRFSQRQNDMGLWHLLTDCHPPSGTVGIAYIGVICEQEYGVGLSNLRSRIEDTWGTFAHEVGHNIGSGHSFDNGQGSTGGIMDYGDGYYPAGNPRPSGAIIQFNPLRRSAICTEVTNSQTLAVGSYVQQNGGVCWSTVRNNEAYYQWDYLGDVSDIPCTLNCGEYSYRSQVPTCRKYNIDNTIQIVSDSECQTAGEALSNEYLVFTSQCKGLPSCTISIGINGECGNSILEPGQYCEAPPSGDTCCETTSPNVCNLWKTTPECVAKNYIVDASFVNTNGELWVFAGTMYSVFPSWDASVPKAGYPKDIADLAGLGQISSDDFTSRMRAAMSVGDNQAYLFARNQMVKISLEGDGSILTGYPKTIEQAFNLDANRDDIYKFEDCLQQGSAFGVNAAINVGGGKAWLICEGITLEFTIGSETGSQKVVYTNEVLYIADTWRQIGTYDSMIRAAAMNPATGRVRLYYGEYNVVWWIGGNVIEEQMTLNPPLGDGASAITGCLDQIDKCVECHVNGQCVECEEGYYTTGDQCISLHIMAYLDFEDGSANQEDYISNWPEIKTAIESRYETDTWGSSSSKAAGLIPTDVLQLQRRAGDPTDEWKLKFYYKPASLETQRLLTLRRSVGINQNTQAFTVDLGTNPSTGGTSNEVTIYGETVTLSTTIGWVIGQWHKVTIQFNKQEVSITVDSETRDVAMANQGGIADPAVVFSDWWIGEDSVTEGTTIPGINGAIDDITVELLYGPLTNIPNLATTVIVFVFAYGIVGILIITMKHLMLHCKDYLSCNAGPDMYKEKLLQQPAQRTMRGGTVQRAVGGSTQLDIISEEGEGTTNTTTQSRTKPPRRGPPTFMQPPLRGGPPPPPRSLTSPRRNTLRKLASGRKKKGPGAKKKSKKKGLPKKKTGGLPKKKSGGLPKKKSGGLPKKAKKNSYTSTDRAGSKLPARPWEKKKSKTPPRVPGKLNKDQVKRMNSKPRFSGLGGSSPGSSPSAPPPPFGAVAAPPPPPGGKGARPPPPGRKGRRPPPPRAPVHEI